jgi:DNA-binding Xre family transcriptional regulator
MRGFDVRVSYNRFFKLLIDKQMRKGELCRQAGISTNTMQKMAKSQNLTVDLLARICKVLDCTMDDILELIPDTDEST